ncbi:MAG: hypothetical protein ACI9Y1_002935, partial [Lentisphaeria bacterium]
MKRKSLHSFKRFSHFRRGLLTAFGASALLF